MDPDQSGLSSGVSLSTTRRATVPALEDLLGRPFPVLDHGFLRVVDYMGDDAAIVQAARVSYGAGTRTQRDDRGLIRYLLRHRHSTPFEMCELKVHVKLPIFVARQWIRHRTASVNEISARYSILDREFYLPRPEDLAGPPRNNKQGRGAALSTAAAASVLDLLREDALRSQQTYEVLLNDRGDGQPRDDDRPQLARELARLNLPLSSYTQWYWKVDLHNLMHFLSLRADPHAQWEIRAYAEILLGVLDRWVPHAAEAFRDFRLGGAYLSAVEVELVRRLVRGESAAEVLADPRLSRREAAALRQTLGLTE